MESNKTTIIYCFGGVKNYGDDYILDIWIEYYRKNFPDRRLIVARPESWLIGQYWSDENVHCTGMFQGLYWKRKNQIDAKKENLDAVELAVRAGVEAADDFLVQFFHHQAFVQSIESVHFCGGGYLNGIFLDTFGMASLFGTLSQRLNLKLIGTGLGLTPLPPQNPKIGEILSRFSLLECRDEESSVQVMGQYPSVSVKKGMDDTFISEVKISESPSKDPVLWICIQSDLDKDKNHPAILDKISEIVSNIRSDFKIGYICLHDGPDQIFQKKLSEKGIRLDYVMYEQEILDNGLPLKVEDLCITTRFHLHLLAARAGVRGAFVWNGDAYYGVKQQSILALGSNWLDLMRSPEPARDLRNSVFPAMDEGKLRTRKKQTVESFL